MKPINLFILNKVCNLFVLVSLLCLHSSETWCQQTSEDFIFNKELEQTVQIIVMLNVDYDGESSGVGSGIIFGHDKDRLLIVTASHVIKKGSIPAKNISIRLKTAPDKLLKATVLKQVNKGESLDLAVLSVANLAKQGINVCGFPFDRLRRQRELQRKDEVIPIGNPNGRSWAIAVEPDKISGITESEIVFQSANIKSGHSGGALTDTHANLVGMVTADEAPLGHAMTIDAVTAQLKQWGYQVLLSTSDFREDRYDLPLHVAADSGNIVEIKKLLASCNNPNQVDYQYRTPLHYAALKGNIQAMSLLLNAGAIADVQDFNEMYPLNLAIARNHFEAVKFLIKAGAKINNKTPGDITALHDALIEKANPEIVLYLIKAGANVNAQDDERNSPLHYAVETGNVEIVKALTQAGASLNAENERKSTPLELAVIRDNLQMISLLIELGAKVKVPKTSKAFSLLHTAAAHSNNIETLNILLKAGANVNAIDDRHATPLHYAVSRAVSKNNSSEKLLAFISVLLQAGADPNVKDEEGRTPLLTLRKIFPYPSENYEENKIHIGAIENLFKKFRGN